MAGGFESSDPAVDGFEVGQDPSEEDMKPERKRRSKKKKDAFGNDDEDDAFGGLSMFFEHQELDESAFPKEVHRCIKQEDQDYANRTDAIVEEEGDSDDEMPETEDEKPPKEGAKSRNSRNYRNVRTPGGRNAVSRPVSMELNSDDEIIVNMKRKRISDRKIADYLRESGRVNYNPKTIGTRFMRIRAKLAQARDNALDAGNATWTAKDDKNLLLAVHAAEKSVNILKDAAESKKWDLASRELSKIDVGSGFSSRACKERYENIKSDKAVASSALLSRLDTPAQNEVKRIEKILAYYSAKLVETKKEAMQEIDDAHAATTAALSNGRAAASQHRPTMPRHASSLGGARTPATGATDFAPSKRAMDVDVDLTGLDTWMLRTMRTAGAGQDGKEGDLAARLAADGLVLPAVEEMTMVELQAELEARGLQRDGRKEKLAEIVRAARAGKAGSLVKSILAPDEGRLRGLLKKRRDGASAAGAGGAGAGANPKAGVHKANGNMAGKTSAKGREVRKRAAGRGAGMGVDVDEEEEMMPDDETDEDAEAESDEEYKASVRESKRRRVTR